MLTFKGSRWAVATAVLLLLAVCSFSPAGIIQAIVPQAVPTANKQGNGTLFQLSTGSTTTNDCVKFDANGNTVDAGSGCGSGASVTPGSTLFSSTTSAGPNNTAAETSLIGTTVGSTTIPANTFVNGTLLHTSVQGFFSLPAVSDSLTLKVKCGSTVLGSAALTPGAGVLSNGTFRVWLDISARGSGAGGSLITNGLAELTGSALTPTEAKILNTSTVAFDFTTTCVMDMTAQWGAAQVGELMTGTGAQAWFPGAPVTSVNGATGAVTTPGGPNPSSTATNYYISTGGSDSNVCSTGSKCLTLAHALSLLPTIIDHPFIVNVADGTYAEGITLAGFSTTLQGSVKVLGNTGTPANVVFSGTLACAFPDSVGSYTVDVCAPSGNFILSGMKFTGSGTSRAVFAFAANLILDNVTVSSNATVSGIQCSLQGTIGLTGTILVNTFQSGAIGIYANQHSYIGHYAGAVTVAGPTGNNTAIGVDLQGESVYDIHQGTAATLTITGVQTGIFGISGSQFINRVSTASPSVTITNTATPTASQGIWMEAALYISNPGTLSMDHFTTCLLADTIGQIVQKGATTTNCGTVASPAANCATITSAGTVCTF